MTVGEETCEVNETSQSAKKTSEREVTVVDDEIAAWGNRCSRCWKGNCRELMRKLA